MLPNKILSNQTVSEPKREAVANQLNQNSSDRKFEDAMYESRQHQLNSEQRQNAARNDHFRQQQRQQQEQTQSRVEADRQAERITQSKNSNKDDKVPQSKNSASDYSETSRPDNKSSEDQQSNVSKNDPKESDVINTKPNKENEILVTEDNLNDVIPEDSEAKTVEEDISWLDTFMKIVADNEQEIKQGSLEDSPENIVINNTEQNTSEQAEVVPNNELINMLLGSEQSAVKKLFTDFASLSPEQQQDDSEIQFAQLTSQLAEKMTKDSSNLGAESDKVTPSNSDGSEQEKLISNLLAETQGQITKSDKSTLTETDLKFSTDGKNAKDLMTGNAQIATNSEFQQQIIQAQNTEVTKQPSLVEQSSKTNNVLNFVNPTLLEMSKKQSSTDIEGGKFTAKFTDELEGVMNPEVNVSNKNDKTLDTELKSVFDIRSASLFANNTDNNTKAAESFNKPELVDVNGVQLDKTLLSPKLEQLSQAKNENVLRENILFNKQELANHMQQQVGLMLSKNMKSIDIRLDPPELGAMQIKLTMNNDQAAVSFVVSNQQAKDALDASLPRLRELLEQQGMDLAESDVQHGSAQSDAETGDGSGGSNAGNGLSNEDGQDDANLLAQEQLNRAIKSPWSVDYYA